MATQLQIRRGTTAQMTAFTGAEGEIAVNTSTDTVHVHDGSTAGGFALAKADGSNIGTYAGSFTTLAASGEITASGGIALGDSDKATFGASDDLQIYHDGSNSRIVDVGTGIMTIQASSQLGIYNADGTQVSAEFVNDGKVGLRFSGSEKLATTATGIDVTGTVTADGVVTQATANTYPGGAAIIKSLAGDSSYITNVGGSFLISNNSSSDQFVLTSAGNMGVGTTSTYNMKTTIAGAGSALSTGTGSYAVASIYDTATAAVGTGGGLAFQGDDGINSAVTFATVNGSKENATAGNYASYLGFSTRANGGNLTEKMRLTAAGRVGIGTSTPDTTLHLQTPNGTKSEINFAQTAVTNYRIGVPASTDALVFTYGASTERMRITSAGKLIVNGTIAGYSGTGITIGSPSAGSSGLSILSTTTGYGYLLFGDTTGDATGGYSGQINYSHGTNRMGFNTNNSERFAIDGSGNAMVGTTTQYFARFSVQGETFQNAVTVRVGTNGYPAINFQNTSAQQQGYIVTNASSVQYISISDERAKENIADADDAGSKIDSIQVRKFDWIADGSHQDYGMIAQELQAVAPEAVSGDADSENMMGVDYSKLVPMLVKEIQSLRTRVQELENN